MSQKGLQLVGGYLLKKIVTYKKLPFRKHNVTLLYSMLLFLNIRVSQIGILNTNKYKAHPGQMCDRVRCCLAFICHTFVM